MTASKRAQSPEDGYLCPEEEPFAHISSNYDYRGLMKYLGTFQHTHAFPPKAPTCIRNENR